MRSGAGFHVLKLVERKDDGAVHGRPVARAPHPAAASAELTAEAAARRLLQFKRDILAGAKTFEQLARENSEDASAAQGGDLGWTAPGSFVPEFEEAMAALPVGGISDPVTTRFGLHLIQVVDRRQTTLDSRQLREQARNILREQKFEAAFAEWLRDLRGRAYIEFREPPQYAARATAARRGLATRQEALRPALPRRRVGGRPDRRARSIRGRAKPWSRSAPAAAR